MFIIANNPSRNLDQVSYRYLIKLLKYPFGISIIISIKKYYKLKYRNSSIIIGLFFIAIGIVVMIGLEKLIQNLTRDIVIDPELEKYIYPR